MTFSRRVAAALFVSVTLAAGALAQESSSEPWEPRSGQAGRDVVWVPTPAVTVEKMLDVAGLKPDDYVIDLGSGDGRNVIAAAKRGAHGHGVEYNEKMVELSNRLAREAGVADKARFIQGDMYEADLSKATVLPLFLLTHNLNKLAPKFLDLKPGARIVVNGFRIDDWQHDEEALATGDCGSWCRVYLYIVPAKVEGAWKIGAAQARFDQSFQMISGSVGGRAVSEGRLRGAEITFRVGEDVYVGRIEGDTIRGEIRGPNAGKFVATRA